MGLLDRATPPNFTLRPPPSILIRSLTCFLLQLVRVFLIFFDRVRTSPPCLVPFSASPSQVGFGEVELSAVQQIVQRPTKLIEPRTFQFNFSQPEFHFECFYGSLVTVSYEIRAVVSRGYGGSVSASKPFAVVLMQLPKTVATRPLDVGIPRCLHIEIKFNSLHLDLDGVLIGQINFALSRIPIVYAKVTLYRREVLYISEKPKYHSAAVAEFQVCVSVPSPYLPSPSLPPRYPYVPA